eukprot:13807017-Alexandrium_andersonii.AAC.1
MDTQKSTRAWETSNSPRGTRPARRASNALAPYAALPVPTGAAPPRHGAPPTPSCRRRRGCRP